MILIERYTPKGRLLGYNCEGTLVSAQCLKCSEFLSKSTFFSHKGTKLGIASVCKFCCKLPEIKVVLNEKKKIYRTSEKSKQQRREYSLKNKEKIQLQSKVYQDNNRDKIREHSKKWKKKNKHKVNAHNTARQRYLGKVPKELKKEISIIYKDCELLNSTSSDKYVVDHIIPLKHPDVCGLHTPQNLQLITSLENSKKHNKFDGTYNNDSWQTL